MLYGMQQHNNIQDKHWKRIVEHPVVAVLVANDPRKAVSACKALVDGGVPAVELALRTPNALACLSAVRESVPEMLVIAGTVLTTEQVDAVKAAGGEAAVAPGCNPTVVKHALDAGMSFAPGVCTPSDVEVGLELGCTFLKFFPAEAAGGLGYLKSMAAPYAHLGVQFLPLGGLRQHHVAGYLESNYVATVGGTWICPSDLLDADDYGEVERRAREAADAAVAATSGGGPAAGGDAKAGGKA